MCFAATVTGALPPPVRGGGAAAPLAACNNESTDLLQTSFKKNLAFFKANMAEHSIAQAIRIVGAQICRRLDVLIEASGKPPVQDIEGTKAPPKPLAPHAQAAKDQYETSPVPKKRGRPCKVKPSEGNSPNASVFSAPPSEAKKQKSNVGKTIYTTVDATSSDSENGDNAEVMHFCFVFHFVY